MIAVFAAMDAEVQPLLRLAVLRESSEASGFPITRAEIAGREAIFCQTGLGRRATAAAEAVLGSFSPKAVLSAGTAGGLSPDLNAGDIVLCDRVRAADGASPGDAEPVLADPGLLAVALRATKRAGVAVRFGRSVTVDTVAWGVEEKAQLRSQAEDDIVEMESYWVGKVAQRHGIPFLAVRAVSDGAEDTLIDIPGLVGEDGVIDYSRFLPYVQEHPEHVPVLAQGAESSRRALESLERFGAVFLPAALSLAGTRPA